MALNGRLSNDDLATIPGTNHRVRKDLLAQTVALRAAFQKALGFPLAITDSYRQYSGHYYAQVETFLRYYTRTPQPGRPTKVWNGVTYWQRPGFPMAATPGMSNHGWGTAIDFGAGVDSYGSKAQKWMAANAHRFGWYWPSWAQKRGAAFEPWHYEATPVLASKYRSFLSGLGVDVPSLPDPLEDDMPSAEEIAAAVWAYGQNHAGNGSRAETYLVKANEAAFAARNAVNDGTVWRHVIPGTDPAEYAQTHLRRITYTHGHVVELKAAVNALTGAVRALGQGEQFDEKKFLAGVESAAKKGTAAGAAAVKAAVLDALQGVEQVNANEVAQRVLDGLGARLTGA